MLCRKILPLLLLNLLSGCGYRWHYDYPDGIRPTVMVPFIPGDDEALFTTELISSLDASGVLEIVPRNGDYRLEVSLKGFTNTQVGYRRDPQKINGKIKQNLLATEGRRALSAEITLYLRQTKEIAFGPYLLSADAAYDYVDGDSLKDLTFVSRSGELIEVLPFSLGQLESIESAQEAVQRMIYRRISQKIVDVISSEW